MSPTKLLIGQIFIVFAIMVLGVWAATQWCAAMLGYQPQLGQAWLETWVFAIYRPWQIFAWWYHYDAYAPEVFDKAGTLAGASGFLGCAAAIAGSLWRARQASHVTTYGSARWAGLREIRKAGLLRPVGKFLGTYAGRYLRHDGPEHVMAFAPTRSGEGVGLVVPTLLSWTGSAVIHDVKGENWQLTAGGRARFSHALLFNPTDRRSAHCNPLLEVRRGADEVRDVQNIADVLVDPVPATDTSGYAGLSDSIDRHTWQLLKGVALSTLLGVGTEISFGDERSDLVRALRQSAQQNGARAGDQIVGRSLDIPPTLEVRPGWPLRVLVHRDVVLRPWRQGGA
ncbi:MAG: hypothetical protein EOO76_18915 [Novosphingobium sp.]|nr:MAG: hypothetical protein EOO76_18915 [Novosphingobium sp.]